MLVSQRNQDEHLVSWVNLDTLLEHPQFAYRGFRGWEAVPPEPIEVHRPAR